MKLADGVVVVVLAGYVAQLSGCSTSRHATTVGPDIAGSQKTPALASRQQAAAVKPAANPVPTQAASTPRAAAVSANVVITGPGVVPGINPQTVGLAICDPVCTGEGALADFGTGCTHWLHYYVAGQPAFGMSTIWASMYRAEMELKRHDLRLSDQQAVPLFSILGVPYVAATTISGTTAHCTLSLQIMRAGKNTSVGTAITCSGTQSQVAAALPRVAELLAGMLGVHGLQLPKTTLNTPPELMLIGSYGWIGERALKANQFAPPAMMALAARSPVAAMCALRGLGSSAPACVMHSLTVYPNNSLLFSDVARFAVPRAPGMGAELSRLVTRWPKSCNLMDAVGRLASTGRTGEIAMRRCLSMNPNLPGDWENLARMDGDAAEAIRGGRTADMISEADWSKLHAIYTDWEVCAQRAASLDPLLSGALLELAKSATFASDAPTADAAMQKALQVDPNNELNYWWAIEMYQPKWLDMPARLDAAIAVGVRLAHANPQMAVELLRDLKEEKVLDRAPGLIESTTAALRRQCASAPANPKPLEDVAYLEWTCGNPRDARPDYEAAVKLDPNNAALLQQYGDVLYKLQLMGKSIAALERAEHLNPGLNRIQYDLGFSYRDRGMYPQAVRELTIATKRAPNDPETWLGLALAEQYTNNWSVVYTCCKRASTVYPDIAVADPTNFVPLFAYSAVRTGRVGEATEAVKYARIHGIECGDDIALAVARIAMLTKRYDDAAVECRKAIQENSPDIEPHYLLGLALYKSGNKAEARKEWTTVMQAAKSEWTAQAAAALKTMK